MALFGEIVEPSTRAYCDFEEELETPPEIELQWEGNFNPPKAIPLLIFAEGAPLHELFGKSIPNSSIICSCKQIGSLYQIPKAEGSEPSNYLCLLNTTSQFNDAEVVELLRPWIDNAIQVVSFVSRKIIEFQTRFQLDKPAVLIRNLQSPVQSTKFGIATLEQPNIISGKSAGILSYRLFRNLQGIVFVCYLDQMEMDSMTAQPILDILGKFGICTKTFVAGPSKDGSNLYL